MPTYEYECQKCKYKFEKFQAITDKPVKRCSKCNGKVKRIISSNVNFIFKGSGFYSTDYRSQDYIKRSKEEKECKKTDKKEKIVSSEKKAGKKPENKK